MIQETSEGERIISYAAKSLSDTEKKYCTTEKEALAIVWGVEKFRNYLLGLHFELETDHRALEAFFKPVSTPCARIERWVLRLQTFDFHVVYKKGSSNIADPLSRLSVQNPVEFDKNCESYINTIVASAAIDISEVESASEADETMQKLKTAIETRDYSDPQIQMYKHFRDQICCSGNIIVRGNQV